MAHTAETGSIDHSPKEGCIAHSIWHVCYGGVDWACQSLNEHLMNLSLVARHATDLSCKPYCTLATI